jgi:predicted GNAT family N-acyltransferase
MPADAARFTVRQATTGELEPLLALREQVFCGEQGVSLEAERDGRDADAIHVVALAGGAIIGTCRLLIEADAARVGRMAVAPRWRRRGVGKALLEEAERLAARRGARRATLHAQLAAKRLYARSGYTEAGGCFIEEGMEHVAMDKSLACAAGPSRIERGKDAGSGA